MSKPDKSLLLQKMDAYWRAANYLSVGQIYLMDNPLLQEPLSIEHVKPRLLGSEQLPKIVREMKRKFIESEKYFERVVIDPTKRHVVRIVLDNGQNIAVENLDDFWRTLAKVTPKSGSSSFARRNHTA